VPDARLVVVPPGVDVAPFQSTAETIAARRARILGAGPLRALYVGALSMQKGLYDLAHAIDTVDAGQMTFTLVGPVLPEASALVGRVRGRARVVGKVPQAALPAHYADADLFVFPTIQDGFGVVLSQARAAGLPIVTTPSGGGTDVVTDGVDGWIVPAGDGSALVRRLDLLASDRAGLARMAEAASAAAPAAEWDEAVSRFEAAAANLLGRGTGTEDA
jgi:glycosyltransferase involved in cell wall biosynthesis